jgi:multisubunit Na+/H+ antiporter MnhB subunit
MEVFRLKEIFILSLLLVIFIALFFTVEEMPTFGDVNAPANNLVSQKIKEEHMKDTNSPNMVTAIITDYRAFDTLGETTVLFTAICAVVSVLKKD